MAIGLLSCPFKGLFVLIFLDFFRSVSFYLGIATYQAQRFHKEKILAIIDPFNREIQIKIVYVGPGRSGKTTSLRSLANKFNTQLQTGLTSIKTHGDRTLFFDFFPLDMGRILDYDVKAQFYTVPGQIKYNITNRLVLRKVDGIVFVADSIAIRRNHNILSLKNLNKNLRNIGKNIFHVPLVFQYNKRDLQDKCVPLLSCEEMENLLNAQLKVYAFPTSALLGSNITRAAKKIVSLTLTSLKNHEGSILSTSRNIGPVMTKMPS
jgi:small GTP-binding protein